MRRDNLKFPYFVVEIENFDHQIASSKGQSQPLAKNESNLNIMVKESRINKTPNEFPTFKNIVSIPFMKPGVAVDYEVNLIQARSSGEATMNIDLTRRQDETNRSFLDHLNQ